MQISCKGDCFSNERRGADGMKINDNVYRIDSSKGSYVYLIRGKEMMLVDTGFPLKGKSIRKEIEALGIQLKDIKHILLTHHDIDHIGNAAMLQKLTGATVWASKEDIPYIRGEVDRHSFKKYFKYIFRGRAPENMKPYGADENNIGGIEVIPTPGHTPGHVCLLYKGALFAGDLLESKDGKLRSYPAAWNWDNSLMAESIRKIAGLSCQWVCPAHGKPVISVSPGYLRNWL